LPDMSNHRQKRYRHILSDYILKIIFINMRLRDIRIDNKNNCSQFYNNLTGKTGDLTSDNKKNLSEV
jgi:hypothetical protein